MADSGTSSFLKWLGILAGVIIGAVLVVYVGIPLLEGIIVMLWGLAGIFAVIFKFVLFVGLFIALILGMIMLISWLIREFTD